MMMSKSYNVPQSVRAAARRGLALRKEHSRGGLDTRQASSAGVGSGVQRASNLIQGSVTYDTVKRMLAFFNRHKTFKPHHKDKTSAAYISWLLWGGDAGYSWVRDIVKREERVEKGTLLALVLFGDDYPEETRVTSFTELLKAVKRDPLDFEEGDLIPAEEGEEVESSSAPPLQPPKDATPAEEEPLTEEQLNEYLEDLNKAVVVIDLVDPEEREEEDTLPAPPVDPPPLIDLHVPEVRISPIEHTAIKRTAKAARKSPGAEQQAKRQALYIMRGAWDKVDLQLVQSYLSFIDDPARRINALCVGGEAMLKCIKKADPKVPAQYLQGLTGEKREKRKREIQRRATHNQNKTSFITQVRDEVTNPDKMEFLRACVKVSGIPHIILNEVYERGLDAWSAGEHRPGASREVWSRARVYSFCTGGETRRAADADLWQKHTNT